jgi:hypothetical protein
LWWIMHARTQTFPELLTVLSCLFATWSYYASQVTNPSRHNLNSIFIIWKTRVYILKFLLLLLGSEYIN